MASKPTQTSDTAPSAVKLAIEPDVAANSRGKTIQVTVGIASATMFGYLFAMSLRRKLIPKVPTNVLAYAMPKNPKAKPPNAVTPQQQLAAQKKMPEEILHYMEADAKVAAYMFAGKAFGVATALVGSFVLASACATTYALGIHTFKGSTTRLRELLHSTFPSLSVSEAYDEVADEKETAKLVDTLASELRMTGDTDELEMLGQQTSDGIVAQSSKTSTQTTIGSIIRGSLGSIIGLR